jgi:hypothetical protein
MKMPEKAKYRKKEANESLTNKVLSLKRRVQEQRMKSILE